MIEIIKLAYEHPVWTGVFLFGLALIAEEFRPVQIVKVYELKKEKNKDEN